jgi:response regulator NasT
LCAISQDCTLPPGRPAHGAAVSTGFSAAAFLLERFLLENSRMSFRRETIVPSLNVLVIDSRDDRAAIIKAGLASLEDARLTVIATLDDIQGTIAAMTPDVVIVGCDCPGRDVLASLRKVTRPIVMFVEENAPDLAGVAVECGVSAYVVAGLTAERVRPVVEVAMLRFRLVQGLRSELEKTRSDLAARKVIERAKGILMEERRLSEDEAYTLLRRSAMDEGKSILEVAGSVLSVARLLKK